MSCTGVLMSDRELQNLYGQAHHELHRRANWATGNYKTNKGKYTMSCTGVLIERHGITKPIRASTP